MGGTDLAGEIPRQEGFNLVDRMIGDVGQDVSEPDFRINAV